MKKIILLSMVFLSATMSISVMSMVNYKYKSPFYEYPFHKNTIYPRFFEKKVTSFTFPQGYMKNLDYEELTRAQKIEVLNDRVNTIRGNRKGPLPGFEGRVVANLEQQINYLEAGDDVGLGQIEGEYLAIRADYLRGKLR